MRPNAGIVRDIVSIFIHRPSQCRKNHRFTGAGSSIFSATAATPLRPRQRRRSLLPGRPKWHRAAPCRRVLRRIGGRNMPVAGKTRDIRSTAVTAPGARCIPRGMTGAWAVGPGRAITVPRTNTTGRSNYNKRFTFRRRKGTIKDNGK